MTDAEWFEYVAPLLLRARTAPRKWVLVTVPGQSGKKLVLQAANRPASG